MPKKGDPKKGTRRKFFTAYSVVLGAFRKQPAFALRTHRRWPQARKGQASDSPKCFSLGLGRTPKFSHGGRQRSKALGFTKARASPDAARGNFWGTRPGLRKRPAGRTRLSEADRSRRSRGGRVCAGECTWPWTGQKFRTGREGDVQKKKKPYPSTST